MVLRARSTRHKDYASHYVVLHAALDDYHVRHCCDSFLKANEEIRLILPLQSMRRLGKLGQRLQDIFSHVHIAFTVVNMHAEGVGHRLEVCDTDSLIKESKDSTADWSG